MREVAKFPVQSRGTSGRHYMARILIRDSLAYDEQRMSPEGVDTLMAQRANLQQLIEETKESTQQQRREAGLQAERQVEEAASSGTRMSVRVLTQKLMQQPKELHQH
jgi:hypothetical protein